MKDSEKRQDKKADMKRRQTAKLLVGGGLVGAATLPKKWAKPVIEAAVLPTHADTSLTYSD